MQRTYIRTTWSALPHPTDNSFGIRAGPDATKTDLKRAPRPRVKIVTAFQSPLKFPCAVIVVFPSPLTYRFHRHG